MSSNFWDFSGLQECCTNPFYDRVQSTTPTADPQATVAQHEKYGLGILWLVRGNKLIVAGFSPDSQAREAGVLAGDILKAVDGYDFMKEKIDDKGRHRAGNLMLGAPKTMCRLVLLRLKPGQKSSSAQDISSSLAGTQVRLAGKA